MRTVHALLLLGALGFGSAATVEINASKPLADVGDTFLGFTTDYWLNDGPYGDKWAPNGSILLVNLSDPKLEALVGGLAPATWRIGGTPADSVVYEYGNPPECSPPVEKPWPGTKCLSASRWKEILAFGMRTGVSISYGLNGLYGRSKPDDPMNTTNIDAFLHATAAMGGAAQALWAFQLGNELGNGGPSSWRATPQALANDVLRVRALVDEHFPGAAESRPMLVGPDSSPSEAFYKPFLQTAAPALNATTFHSYLCGNRGGGGGPCQADLLRPSTIATDDGAAHDTLNYAAGSPVPSLAVWGGEVGPAYGGGVPGLSDRFGDMLWWVDHLSRLQAIGVQSFARSTLIGGSYELINRTTHEPHPSYFASLAYSRLMGGRSIAAVRSDEDVIGYATCTSKRLSSTSQPRRTAQQHVFSGQRAARVQRDATLAASPCSSSLQASSGAVTAVLLNGVQNASQNVQLVVTGDATPPASSTACVWRFRSGAAAAAAAARTTAAGSDDVPLWNSDSVQWFNGATSSWETLALGPAPGYALPTLASPATVPVKGGSAQVQLGPFEYAFVVMPEAGVSVCKAA